MTKINYKQDNIETLMSALNRVASSLSGVADGFSSSLGNNETLTAGVDKIKSNVDIISQRASSTSSIVSKQNDSFIEGETKITSLYESIEIPTELGNVYSPYDDVESNVAVTKNDGKAVSDDVTSEQELDLKNNADGQETLYDLNDNRSSEKDFEDKYGEDKENLSDITNDNENKEKELDEYVDSEEIGLEDIKEDSNLDEKTLDEYKEQNKTQLNSIDSEETEKKELSDDYDSNKISLGAVSTNDTQAQSFSSSYDSIGQVSDDDDGEKHEPISDTIPNTTPDNDFVNSNMNDNKEEVDL